MDRLRDALTSFLPASRLASAQGRIPLPTYGRLAQESQAAANHPDADLVPREAPSDSVWRKQIRSVAICTLSLLVGIFLARRSDRWGTSMSDVGFATEAGVWSEYGQAGDVRVGTKPLKVLEACNRTLLLQWVCHASA